MDQKSRNAAFASFKRDMQSKRNPLPAEVQKAFEEAFEAYNEGGAERSVITAINGSGTSEFGTRGNLITRLGILFRPIPSFRKEPPEGAEGSLFGRPLVSGTSLFNLLIALRLEVDCSYI
eukprot:5760748-Alexandrium_andersonii.AAC.1